MKKIFKVTDPSGRRDFILADKFMVQNGDLVLANVDSITGVPNEIVASFAKGHWKNCQEDSERTKSAIQQALKTLSEGK